MSRSFTKLPLHILASASKDRVLVETKEGDTFEGTLRSVDRFMNIALENATKTSRTGSEFHKTEVCFIRGTNVRTVQMKRKVLQQCEEESKHGK